MFANAVHGTLIYDDSTFLTPDRFAGFSLADIPRYFREDLWAMYGAETGLYRPLFVLFMALESSLFGDWAAGYHLVNVLLHVAVTLLVFGFFRHLLLTSGDHSEKSGYVALLAAALFGLHPVHTEVVNSVFNGSELLVALGTVGGLWWFLRRLDHSPATAWTGLALVYLLILFCRESAAVLPGMAAALVWIFTPGGWRQRLRRCLPVLWLLLPLGLYFLLRTQALEHAAAAVTSLPPGTAPSETTSSRALQFAVGPQRLLNVAQIMLKGLATTLWPHPLRIDHGGRLLPPWPAVFIHLALLIAAIVLYRKRHPGLLAGLAVFYLGLLPASRLVGEAGISPHLYERYLYIPSIGILLAVAFALRWVADRFRSRAAMVPALVALIVMAPLTWARNADWSSEIALFEREYGFGNPGSNTLRVLTTAYLLHGDYAKAGRICDDHADKVLAKASRLSNRCGSAYELLHRYDDAERAFLVATEGKRARAEAHKNLAQMYLRLERREDALAHFELSVETARSPAMNAYRRAYMLYRLYPHDPARRAQVREQLARALELQPNLPPARELLNEMEEEP